MIRAQRDADVEIVALTVADEMAQVVRVFRQVWGTTNPAVPTELLMAISHSGGYVSAIVDRGSERIVGASVGFLARHRDAPALHSHITGLLPGYRQSGLGRTIKLHQRAWAAARGIEWIVWTFDPLVRRNAWFNIAVLGAGVDEYLPDFYGPMTDGINAGDATDRLLAAWPVVDGGPTALRDGSTIPSGYERTVAIHTPEDVIALRRTDRAAVATWRAQVRAEFTAALARGDEVVGVTPDGDYVLARPR